jgi:hypothetical protein
MYTFDSFVDYFVFPLITYLLAALAAFVCLWTTNHPIMHNYDIWWEFANFMALLSVVMQMLQGRLWLYRYTDGQDATVLHSLQRLLQLKAVLLHNHYNANLNVSRSPTLCIDLPTVGPCQRRVNIIHQNDCFQVKATNGDFMRCVSTELVVEYIKLLVIYYALQCHLLSSEQDMQFELRGELR